MTTTPIPTREGWLIAAIDELRPMFHDAGARLPANILVSVGWPGGHGPKQRVIGQCWTSTEGEATHIFVSPQLIDPAQVLAVLVHELVHAATPRAGHRGRFRAIALKVGLEGPMTATTAGGELTARLAATAERLGEYRHEALNAPSRKPQTTRMLLLRCTESGYKARTARSWLDDYGSPLCPCHHEPMTLAA